MDLLHAHLCEQLFSSTDTDEQVFVKDDTLYKHPLLTINYTTYDFKCKRDPINLGFGNSVVMAYAPTSESTEPWSYVHIIAVYHLFVNTLTDPEPKHLELLWVRWMERSSFQLTGTNSSQYSCISFSPHSGVPGEAFGFVDPSHIIRACRLIPVFNLGWTCNRLGPSMAHDPKGDWCSFYANRYDLTHIPPTYMYSSLLCVQICWPWCICKILRNWDWLSMTTGNSCPRDNGCTWCPCPHRFSFERVWWGPICWVLQDRQGRWHRSIDKLGRLLSRTPITS